MSDIILEEQATPSTPAADKVALYPKAGGGVYKKNDAGTEKQLVEADGTLGTPASGVLTNCTGLLVATGIVAGAADLKLFTNAAGAAPEWANGMKLGTFTKDTADASGSGNITGVGFKPSHVILIAGINATQKLSIGLDNGTVHYSCGDRYSYGADTNSMDGTNSIYAMGGGDDYRGTISAFISDGFTITWTKVGSSTGTLVVYYLAFR